MNIKRLLNSNLACCWAVCFLLLAFVTLAGCAKNEGVKVKISSWGDLQENAILNDLITQFQTLHPEIKVELQRIPYTEYTTKLITQMVLQANNTGWIGYGVSALVGAVLWFATDKTLHNPAASAGIIAGTVVQIIIRLINDYTPFGQYVSQLGMGDYQAQAFLTPQVLVDPYNSAQIQFPAALRAMMAPPAAPSTAANMSKAAGVSGFDPLYSGARSELYG